MNAHQSLTTSCYSHSDSNLRKRVSKACDRCRLKKSKVSKPQPNTSSFLNALNRYSATALHLVDGVGQIILSVSLARGRELPIMEDCTPRGEHQSLAMALLFIFFYIFIFEM